MSIILKLTVKKGQPVLRGYARYWTVMMDFAVAGKSFSLSELKGLCNAAETDIRSFVRRLTKAGFIAEVAGAKPMRWTVVILQSAPPKVRHDGTVLKGASGRQAIWNTIRSPVSRRGFTAVDIAAWGSTDEHRITKDAARGYIAMLADAGYLIQLKAGVRGSPGLWRLAPHMNTGPLPPMILRTRAVYDQNLKEIIGEISAEEERV